MMKAGLLALVVVCAGQGALAGSPENCSKAQSLEAIVALERAKALSVQAASRVGNTPEYIRWFGPYDAQRAEQVRGAMKTLVNAIRTGAVTPVCETGLESGCNEGEFAWVYPGEAYRLRLCPAFFDLPVLTALSPGARSSEYGTREGTIIHELSHFNVIAGTEDHCYSRRDCAEMAAEMPGLAIENADSFQYFTEDVTWYARQPLAGKPAPARP